MITSFRKIICCWLLLILLAWGTGCGRTQSALRDVAAPGSSLPPSVAAATINPPEPEIFQPVPATPPPPIETQFIHKVRWPRETLFSISRWYTGSGNNWHQLAAANPTVRPQAIHIGDVILIPEELLKRRLPMPQPISKPKPANSEKKPSANQNPAPEPKTEAFKLYGPIDRNPQAAEPKSNSELPVPLETLD